MTGLTPRAYRQDDRRHGSRSAAAVGGMHTFHLRVSILPAATMAALGAAIVAFLLASGRSAGTTRVVLAAAVAGAALVLLAAAYGASAATRRVHRQLGALRSVSARGQEDLQRLTERIRRGERPVPRAPEPVRNGESDPFGLLVRDMERGQYAAEQAVLQVAALTPGGEAAERVEVFVNLARRMQSLVHREIQLLDDLEARVEDPDLLKGLFTVDHLATRMRRQSESLAVLGGAMSRRQWNRPVTMHEVLRAAVAEVELYSRVKVVPPVEGVLQGSAVADVIHLIAELIENATKFSAPHTQALLRAQKVTAGLAVEVEDRGLGILPDDQQRMNGLLADPGRINIGELLRDGRIGLFVVSTLARRHGVKVQLQKNIYGGTQAVVVLPRSLIDVGSREPRYNESSYNESSYNESLHDTQQERVPAMAAPAAAASPPVLLPPPPASPPPLPVRSPAQPGEREPGQEQARLSAAAPAAEPSPQRPADPGERPPLPKRRVQSHLAPQLRDAPATRRDDSPVAQIPGLMAAFQKGFGRAEDEDNPAATDTTR